MPSLGNLINRAAARHLRDAALPAHLPGHVLSVVTISFYIIGNAFADAADPKNNMYKY